MFPRSSADVAVSHYSNWSTINWVAAFVVLGLVVLAVAVAVYQWIDTDSGGGITGVNPTSVVAGLGATVALAITLPLVARHIEQFKWVFLLALVVVGAVALAAYRAARRALSEVSYYSQPVPKWTVVVPAAVAGVIAAVVVVVDGFTRAAASVPMTLEQFLAVVVVGGVAAVAYAFSSRSSVRS